VGVRVSTHPLPGSDNAHHVAAASAHERPWGEGTAGRSERCHTKDSARRLLRGPRCLIADSDDKLANEETTSTSSSRRSGRPTLKHESPELGGAGRVVLIKTLDDKSGLGDEFRDVPSEVTPGEDPLLQRL
jgi:hypothetical protein